MDGVLIIDKEKGFTSHDVVAKLRGICRQKKIGHTGTLDPDATGVLPVCLGAATKLCDMLTEKDKVYEAVLLLGKCTETQDTSGRVISEAEVTANADEIIAAICSFIGKYEQLPPMYSAIKVEGKRLYELARQGISVDRKRREVEIFRIEILDDIDCNLKSRDEHDGSVRVKLRVHCSKGTYIRTLCHDIGEKLGCGGCMAELRRVRTGVFSIDGARTLSQIQQLSDGGTLGQVLISIENVLSDYPLVRTLPGYDRLLYNGNEIPEAGIEIDLPEHCGADKNSRQGSLGARAEDYTSCENGDDCAPSDGQAGKYAGNGIYRVRNSSEQFVGLYKYNADRSSYLVEKMFFDYR